MLNVQTFHSWLPETSHSFCILALKMVGTIFERQHEKLSQITFRM